MSAADMQKEIARALGQTYYEVFVTKSSSRFISSSGDGNKEMITVMFGVAISLQPQLQMGSDYMFVSSTGAFISTLFQVRNGNLCFAIRDVFVCLGFYP